MKKAVSGGGGRWYDWPALLPLSVFVAICILCVGPQYQFYVEWLLRFPLLVLILLFLILVTYNRFGQDYGLSHLFWHPCLCTQIRMGFYVSALLALQWTIAYHILRDFDGDKQFRDMAHFRDQALFIPHSFWHWFQDSPVTSKNRAAGIEHHFKELKAAGFKPVHNPHGSFRWWPVDENEFLIANYEPPRIVSTEDDQDSKPTPMETKETEESEAGTLVASPMNAARPDSETLSRTAQLIVNRYWIFFVFTYLPSLVLLALASFPPIAPPRVQGSETAVRRRFFVGGMFIAFCCAFLVIYLCSGLYARTFQQHCLQEAVYHFQTTVITIPGVGDNDRTFVTRGFPHYVLHFFLATLLFLTANAIIPWLKEKFPLLALRLDYVISDWPKKFPLALRLDYVNWCLIWVTFLLMCLQLRVWFRDPSGAAKIADWRAVELIVNMFLLTFSVGLVFYAMNCIYRQQTSAHGKLVTFIVGIVGFIVGLFFYAMKFIFSKQKSPHARMPLKLVTAQGSICIMLAFATTIYGTFMQLAWFADVEGMPVLQGLSLIPLIGYLMWLNNDRFKLRFPGMDHYYKSKDEEGKSGYPNLAKLQDYYQRYITGDDCPKGAEKKPSDDKAVLEKWYDKFKEKWYDKFKESSGAGAQKPKLAIVAVSGGSIRSAVWTAKVLTELEKQIPGFQHHLRLITGASGGMIGATLYAAEMQHPDSDNTSRSPEERKKERKVELEGLVQRLDHDCLHRVACQMALGDLPAIFSRHPPSQDRGKALEQAWEDLSASMLSESKKSSDNPLGSLLCQPVTSLAKGEFDGWRPSLIFSPMLAEDGRRLLISNLDLKFLTRSIGPFLLDKDSRCLKQHEDETRENDQDEPLLDKDSRCLKQHGANEDLYSFSAYQFFDLFCKARSTFKLSTAIRMSASFPYISPAVNLPTIPPLRVVDAGYYDNFGVNIAMSWITHHRQWLLENTSGVVLIQIRAFDSPREIESAKPNSEEESRDEAPHIRSWKNSLHWLTTPIDAARQARRAGMSFRNDEQIAVFASWLRKEMKTPDDGPCEFFQTICFDCKATASLNWYIKKSEFDSIVGCLNAQKNSNAENTRNWKRLETLIKWWKIDHAPPPPSGAGGANSSSAPNPTHSGASRYTTR